MRWIVVLLMLSCSLGPGPVEYTVKRGDTLGKIAKQYGVGVDDLRSWNGISGDLIEVGQVLHIRVDSPATETAKTMPKPRKAKRATANKGSQKKLRLPPKKKCLDGPSLDDLNDDVPEIQGSKGLSYQQIQQPMAAFLPTLGRCFSGTWPEAKVLFEMTTGCDGRVSKVVVLDDGGLSGPDLDCMRSTLSFVGFPAHDMPGGMTFQYPITLGS